MLAFCTSVDICTFARCNKRCCEYARVALYQQPDLSGSHGSPFSQWIHLLSLLPTLPLHLRNYIQIIDLRWVEEEIYTRVPSNWLEVLVECCPHLKRLSMVSPSFLTDQCIRLRNTRLTCRIEELEVYDAQDLTLKGWPAWTLNLPELKVFRVRSCPGFRDDAFVNLVYSSTQLQVLDLRGCRNVTDIAFQRAATFLANGKSRISFLDVSETKISDIGLVSLVHAFRFTLQSLILGASRQLSLQGIVNAIAIPSLSLIRLDLSEPPNLPSSILYSLPLQLHILSIPHSVLLQDPVIAHNALVRNAPRVLKVYQVDENKLSALWWQDVCQSISENAPSVETSRPLEKVILYRNAWTTVPEFGGYEMRGDLQGFMARTRGKSWGSTAEMKFQVYSTSVILKTMRPGLYLRS